VRKKITYVAAATEKEYNDGMILFQEYANSLNISLDFQHFDEELKIIGEMYGPPEGILIIAYFKKQAVGCAALRKIDEGICEVKRMYVQPSHRRLHIGNTLLEMLINKAVELKYSLMRLDTLDHMIPAITLYQHHGFYKIDAYYFNPNSNTVYMEKSLVP
jgi:ribosomal protein S18 acetylase RimI-like enzyme